MLYPTDISTTSFLVIDPDHPIEVKDINVPYYPSIGDVVQVKNSARSSPGLVLVKRLITKNLSGS